MENTNKRKRRLFTILCSMVLCMLLIGVSVWAALTQTATLTNTLKIKASGQARADIVVSTGIGSKTPTDGAAFTFTPGTTVAPALSPEPVLNKPYTDDEETVDLTEDLEYEPIEFKYGSYRFYIFEIYVKNYNGSQIKVGINAYNSGTTDLCTFNEQLEIYLIEGTTLEGEAEDPAPTAIGGNQLSFLSGDLAIGGTQTYFFVISVKNTIPLEDIANVEEDLNFDLVITANAPDTGSGD